MCHKYKVVPVFSYTQHPEGVWGSGGIASSVQF
jgi:hypothetical protein